MTIAPPGPDDLVHEYTPRGSALALLQCRDDEVLVSGPAGTGKSRACLEKMLLCALLNQRFLGLIARKTGVSLTSTTLETWKKYVAVEAIKGGLCVYYGGSREEPPQYRFTNGARILLTGMNDPAKIMSSEFDLIYVGEATELTTNDWEFFTTRLRNGGITFQQIIADCNPGPPTHWLKKRTENGSLKIMYSAHWENPRYYRELADDEALPATVDATEIEVHHGKRYRLTPQGVAYIGRLRNLTGVRKLRLYDGVWAAADGLVYDNWSPEVHHVPKFVPPKEWRRYWAIDFGYTNPFVCQFWAEDEDGRLWLYREIYMTRTLVEDHARAILRTCTRARKQPRLMQAERKIMRDDRAKALELGLLEWVEPEPTAIVCDHDAEGRATLEKYLGRGTTAARKSVAVRDGIEAVESRLKVQADGKPRLFVMQNCTVTVDSTLDEAGLPTGTADEHGSYVWAPPKPGKAPKEEPLKENDHGMDAERYIVVHKDRGLRIRDRDNILEG